MYRTGSDGKMHWTRRGLALIIVLVVSLLMMGFGVQQWFYQHQASERDACYQTWGTDVLDAVKARQTAQKAVENVNQDRADAIDQVREQHDEALDTVILDFLGLRQTPPTSTLGDIDRALVRFSEVKVNGDRKLAHAKRRATKALNELNKTRHQNPYPVLDCN